MKDARIRAEIRAKIIISRGLKTFADVTEWRAEPGSGVTVHSARVIRDRFREDLAILVPRRNG